MAFQNPFRAIPWLTAFFAASLPFAMGKSPDAGEGGNRIRIVCVSTVNENQEVILRSQDDKGHWRERATFELRTSLVTDWLPAQVGELDVAIREEGKLKSICQFTYPEGCRRALAVLSVDPEKKNDTAKVIDPKKLGFVKGSMLIFNFSAQTSVVHLGSKEQKIEAGQIAVATPTLEDNGMYRMKVSSVDADGKDLSRFDRYVSGDSNSRSMMFLVSDAALGMKVLSLPLFGELD